MQVLLIATTGELMSLTTATGAAGAALALVLLGGGPAAGAGWHSDDPSPSPSPTATEESAHSSHSAHSGSDEPPAETGHDDHGTADGAGTDDHSSHDDDAQEGGASGSHGGGADSVSTRTRLAVLGGFGAVNATVVGTAFLLRRRHRSSRRSRRAGR